MLYKRSIYPSQAAATVDENVQDKTPLTPSILLTDPMRGLAIRPPSSGALLQNYLPLSMLGRPDAHSIRVLKSTFVPAVTEIPFSGRQLPHFLRSPGSLRHGGLSWRVA